MLNNMMKYEKRLKDFKYVLRVCRQAKERHKTDALASSLQDHTLRKFWEHIRKENRKTTLPTSVQPGMRRSQPRGKTTLKL